MVRRSAIASVSRVRRAMKRTARPINADSGIPISKDAGPYPSPPPRGAETARSQRWPATETELRTAPATFPLRRAV